MIDEELEKLIKDIDERIDNLPEKEGRRRDVLSFEKEILQKIMLAREKGDKKEEIVLGARLVILKSLGEKHPFLASMAMSDLGLELFH